MKNRSEYYRDTPVGQQLGVFFENRASLRRTISLFPSWRELFGRAKTKIRSSKPSKADSDLSEHAAGHA